MTQADPAARARTVTSHLHVPLMLALTFATGIIDAVGYLGLDRVFTGNMTGNVVVLGMGLVGADDLPVRGPFVALVCFMAGAALAGVVLRQETAGWSSRTTTLLTAGGLLMAAIAVALLVIDLDPGVALTVTGLLGLAMGLQAGTARHVAVKDVTTVVVTSTLTGLAFDAAPGTDGAALWRRRAGAVVLILLGASVGALLLRWHPGAGIGLAALITLAVALLGHRVLRRTPPTTAGGPA
ncbi:uncharacterized membrane protein YoaK (UPF0700 family) [Sediminihabitans luteus]|uniref:Uncharacterized membrane protein YoaK (UPF0700 family) n=1 Tax=Sediminihabitans luteus TaxID=1138585 RepID=A0A2M9CYD7_9CELL|nr:YoaK family protein [Sediminihabitans luteus]PJJ76952.1 uncharacterized membrane protein YoaK (UPF0700 family) [Sediminihabitans luteus]GII99593.1 DUF1275 family protein [Sediminihabitans luteus]